MDNKLLLSITEAANILSVSRGTIYNLLETGALKRVHIGKSARVTVGSVRALVGEGASTTRAAA